MSQRVALVDTNLLVLLCVGLSDRGYIKKHKLTSAFAPEDFDLLTQMLSSYEKILVTPNILSECSNFLAQTSEPVRKQVLTSLRLLVERHKELYVQSADAAKHSSYLHLGLTDAAIHVAADQAAVLTTDLDLYLSLLNAGKEAFNFNHIRERGWQGYE